MNGPFRRRADSGDERVQRRLRELGERVERPEPPRPAPPPRRPAPGPPRAPAPPLTTAPSPRPYAPPPPFATTPRLATQKPRLRWAGPAVAAFFCLLVVLAVVGRIEANGPQGWTSKADPNTKLDSMPAPPDGVGSAPLGEPPTDVPNADTYAFMDTQEDSDAPVTYDPCAPIHYVVNDRAAFDGAKEELDAAVEQIEEATGLVFVYDGETEEAPIRDRAVMDKRYGKSWSPVLVAWSDKYEYGGLDDALGRGGSREISLGQYRWFVTGTVTLNGPWLHRMYKREDGPTQVRAVMMHELGHLVGLHHVSAKGEIMKPATRDETATWGPGDRAGLAQLGSGNCLTY